MTDPVQQPNEDDIEAAYLQALNALDAAEDAFHDVLSDTADQLSAANDLDADGDVGVSVGEHLDEATDRSDVPIEPEPGGRANVTPEQIVEAALFVGGKPLATRHLRSLFRGDVETDDLVQLIDQLNTRYATENRPYEVRLVEGGYSFELRDEHQALQRKVFGLGPREVRLTQEALEVLALVAYHQPITRDEIEDLGKDKPGGVLRHLLRRQLIQIERTAEGGGEVRYRTTDRFLQLVGIGDLSDLPRADALSFK